MDASEETPADGSDLPLYHATPTPTGPRPLWCTEPGCEGTLTEPYHSGVYKCPRCGKGYCGPEFRATPETWPEAFPGHRALERKKAATDAAAAQTKFKLKF